MQKKLLLCLFISNSNILHKGHYCWLVNQYAICIFYFVSTLSLTSCSIHFREKVVFCFFFKARSFHISQGNADKKGNIFPRWHIQVISKLNLNEGSFKKQHFQFWNNWQYICYFAADLLHFLFLKMSLKSFILHNLCTTTRG